MQSGNTWDVIIGIGPDNPNNESSFYEKSSTFICGQSNISIKSWKSTKYNSNKGKLKKGDIVEVIIDRSIGNLSFAINGENYGIACSNIPSDMFYFQLL